MDLLFEIAIAAVITVLIAVSAYFSIAETSYTSLNQIRVKNLVYEGKKNAGKALRIYENYDRMLTTAVVGTNIVNVVVATLGALLFTELFGNTWGFVWATIFSVTVIVIFAEITPKTLAKKNSERYALRVAGSIEIAMKILSPITWVFVKITNLIARGAKDDSKDAPALTEDELHVMIDEVTEDGELEESEGELIKSAMQFDDIKVSDMYTPRSNVTAVDIKTDIEDLKKILVKTEYSRLPVYDKSVDRIIGAVHMKDFFAKYVMDEPFSLADIMMPVKFVPANTSIATLLSDFQRTHIHMAVVLDNFGRTLGIVTMEDLLEELVGDIWDESDVAGYPIFEEKDGSFITPAEAHITDVMKKLGVEYDPEGLQNLSLSSFISQNTEGVPKRGDTVILGNSTITVKSMKSRRVKEVKITINKKVPDTGIKEN